MSISDLSCHVSDYCINITRKSDRSITVIYHAMSLTTVSVSPRRLIGLSVIYHAMSDYCINITRKSDRSITVIYHAMSLTTLSISLRRVIGLSQWFIMLCLWLLYQYHQEEWYVNHSELSRYFTDYSISITKSDRSITVIYHAMSLITVSVSPGRVIGLWQWFITLCLWLLYQYH
jgi:hypothetical protein